MSEWNNLNSTERISKWKQFRSDVKHVDDYEILCAVARFFADVPIGRRTLDFYTPDSWDTPWEILYDGKYCQNSVSLLMYYTLSMCLCDYDVKIILIDDGEDMYLVPLVNDRYILNYELGAVNEFDSLDIKIKQTFEDDEIKHFK